ncbi:unnamed protein product [Linum trigynum]|uniref:Uncharacterized protein n=1 Tax=Linum trigynum TaxID=586398 RepID=A0AAV2DAL9_9ROSI
MGFYEGRRGKLGKEWRLGRRKLVCTKNGAANEASGSFERVPFTFSEEATLEVFEKRESRCSFLSKRGIHGLGMWKYECERGLKAINRWTMVSSSKST